MGRTLFLLVLVALSVLLAIEAATSVQDECLRGTWKQVGNIVYVCPNPGNGEWGGAASFEEIAKPQKWQELNGKREFLKPGQLHTFKKQKIVAFCEAESAPYPKGDWEIGFDIKRSRYRYIKEVGIMLLCK